MKIKKLTLSFVLLFTVGCLSTTNVQADCKSGNNAAKPAKTIAPDKSRLVKTEHSHFYIDAKTANQEIKQHPQTVVLETSYGKKTSYAKGHLPRAVQFDTLEIETEQNHWNILSFKQCRDAFLKKGITKNTPVLVYSEDALSSARVEFVGYWLGIKNIKIVDGGLNAWKNNKLPLQKGTLKPLAKSNFGRQTPAHPEDLIRTANDFRQYRQKHPKLVLASTRSWDEYVGNISGYNYIKNTGEVNGAVYAQVSKTSSDVYYLMNKDWTMKNPQRILQYWKSKGITPNKETVFYCGTGWRACPAFFLAKDNGWKQVHIFDGGWYDWDKSHQKHPQEFPVQKGNPSDKKHFKIIKQLEATN